MRKIKEVLRLQAAGLSQHQIARACRISQSTVHAYRKAAEAAGLNWPLPEGWDERRLEELLGKTGAVPKAQPRYALPEFADLRQQLQQHRHLTLHQLWLEYRETHLEGYRYSRFCELYRRWLGHQDVVLRQEHRAGEKLFVDYAGDTVPLHDPHTGEIAPASIFVAVLGASNYTFAEATASQDLADWIGSHVRAFEFFGGVPQIVVPDNAKTGVAKACRYEPDLNPTYQDLAAHYGVAVVPARPRKPRDKAKVEAGVLVAERWILAALRHRKFFGLGELNAAIAELRERLNQRPFRKREGCRASLFETLDRPALRPLPVERYQFGVWRRARVNIDYHVEVERHFYSVPYQLTGQPVEVRLSADTVEIFHRGVRVASHPRSRTPHQPTTVEEHRPKSHQKHLEWTPSRIIHWAGSVGPATAALVEHILASRPHPEMGYRSCLGVLRLSQQYGPARMEAAARRAVALGACTYQSLKSILERQLDRLSLETPAATPAPVEHDNLRGPDYFQMQ
jgi:transposase